MLRVQHMGRIGKNRRPAAACARPGTADNHVASNSAVMLDLATDALYPSPPVAQVAKLADALP